jgi:hypothetical protein
MSDAAVAAPSAAGEGAFPGAERGFVTTTADKLINWTRTGRWR